MTGDTPLLHPSSCTTDELLRLAGVSSAVADKGVVVLESTRRWESALKWEWRGTNEVVRACRLERDAWQMLEALSAGILLLEFSRNPGDQLHLTARIAGQLSHIKVILLANPDLLELEWAAHELGAAAVLPDNIAPQTLARLCRRILR